MVNVELLQYWLELVSVKQCLSLPNYNLSLPNSDLSLPNWAVIVLYFRHWSKHYSAEHERSSNWPCWTERRTSQTKKVQKY